ncbi:MAG: dienelactone hydrolase family protein [Sphingobacteriaceae bacterium]|nr:dienelactone hydrolase family protein [Cytophagaceae bacterium]
MRVSFAQTVPVSAGFEKSAYQDAAGNVLPYRILFPKNYDRTQKYPLVLFLHGAGERGADNEKQLTHGGKLFLDEKARTDFPAIVVFPQCPPESYWSSVKIDREKRPMSLDFSYNDRLNWPTQAAIDLVKNLLKTEGVDKNRVYLMGLSMGGMGTFETLSRYPKLFAAATPICGGGDPDLAKKYAKRLPLWVFHGDADPVVEVKYSREMVAKLKELRANVQYTEYPGVGHDSWNNALAEPKLLPWLFGQKK